jgi:hypothetical protein
MERSDTDEGMAIVEESGDRPETMGEPAAGLMDGNVLSARKDCFYKIPQRVIDASVLPEAEFEQVDFMGYEKVALPTGDHLLIINWGCESYNLSLRFETSRFGTDTSRIKHWYSILTQLLYIIEPAVDAPVRIQEGIDEIHHYLSQDTMPITYNVPLILRKDSLYSEMLFERIKILGDTAVRLDATFSISLL